MQNTGSSRIIDKLSAYRETLFGAFGIMIVAVLIASAINYLFNIVMDRMLGTAAFGDLYSLEAVFLMATIGALSIQTVVTKYVAEFEATGEDNKFRLIVRSFSRWMLFTGVSVLLISVALAWPLGNALKLESPLFIVILGAGVGTALYTTVPMGVLQGKQRFAGLGAATISMAALRITLGVVLVLLGLGVYGALGASFIANVIVIGVVLYVVREVFRGPVEPVEDFRPVEALKFLVPVAAAMFLIIVLAQIDVVLVKALFSRTEAGHYSYAALAGKAILFLPEGVSLVMFPWVSEMKARGEPTRNVLVWSLTIVSVMVLAVAGFYGLFPHFTAYFFAGSKGEPIVGLVGLFGLVMAVLAIVKLLAFYHLALEKKGFIWFFAAAAVAEMTGILLFHGSLRQVLVVMLVVGLSLLVVNIILAFREEKGTEAV